MTQSGVFLSLDGIDGCGKSTQCRLLSEWLCSIGHETTECIDPGGTAAGNQIREILLSNHSKLSTTSEMFLFMASRAQLCEEVIRPALKAGRIIVSDRFLLANVVYQGHAGGLDVDQLWSVGELATGGTQPDLTIVLDLPLEQALARRNTDADRMESRDKHYHERVRLGFLTEAKRRNGIVVVDASQPVEAVHQRIQSIVGEVLQRELVS